MPQEDAQLVSAALRGDHSAFAALVDRHYRSIFQIANARLDDVAASEDLTQEVFLRAHLHLRELDDPARFAAWICQISRHLASDWQRRRQRASRLITMVHMEADSMAQLPDANTCNPREHAQRVERQQAVRKALAGFPVESREIVLLYYVEGLSEREIAQRFGVHRTTVRYHRIRAARSLRTRMLAWLTESAPATRAKSALAVKAGAAVLAAASLPQSARAALVEASSATMPAAASAKAGAGTSALFAGKIIGAIAPAGAIVMNGKTVVAVIAAAGIVAGGAYLSGNWPGASTSSATGPSGGSSAGPPSQFADTKQAQVSSYVLKVIGATPPRVVLEAPLPSDSIDPGRLPGPRSPGADDAVRSFLTTNYGITFSREKRPSDVLVLRAAAARGAGMTPASAAEAGQGFSAGPGYIASKSSTMENFVRRLEEASGVPVVDETGLTGYWKFDLRWNPSDPATIDSSILQQLGLNPARENREVELVVVKPDKP